MLTLVVGKKSNWKCQIIYQRKQSGKNKSAYETRHRRSPQ